MSSDENQGLQSDDNLDEVPDTSTGATARLYLDLLEESRIKDKVLEVSTELIRHTGSETYLENALAKIVTICQEAIGADTSVIEVFDEKHRELVGVAEFGKPYNPDGYFRLPLDESALSTLAFLENRTIAIDDVEHDERVSQRVRKHFDAKSGIASPLTVDGKAIGVLLAMTRHEQRKFTDRDIRLMDGLATQAALAVFNQLQRDRSNAFETRFQRLVENAPMAILILDRSGKIAQANQASELLTGNKASNLVGQSFSGLFERQDDIELHMGILDFEEGTSFEACIQEPDGSRVHVGVSANLVSIDGKVVIQAFLRNITKRKVAEEQLSSEKEHAQELAMRMTHIARHDSLTGLVNRGEFEKYLQDFIDDAHASGKMHVICFVDLDRFKIVNDTGGHAAGDEMLKQITAIVSKDVRKSDIFSRLGGDEFGLLLEDCSIEKAEQLCNKICAEISEYRLHWEGKVFSVSASIGLAPITATSKDVKSVLKAVDSACFLAKEQGRNRVSRYEAGNLDAYTRSGDASWAQRIKEAIEQDHFRIERQGIRCLSLTANDFDWCEVLLKLKIDDKEYRPSAFLSCAERYHLMPEIDQWVVRSIFNRLGNIPDQRLLQSARFNINISGQSLNDHGLFHTIESCLAASPVKPHQVCFEITETSAAANFAEAIDFCHRLKELGFLLALDDFGAGMSSFVYLKELPVDILKIDGYFVKNLARSRVDYEMISAINRIAHSMDIVTVAEKVEDEETLAAVRELGVDFAQGYHLHLPEPF